MFLLDERHELAIGNETYEEALKVYLWDAFMLDLADGDITSEIFPDKPGKKIRANIVAKESGILAGMQEVQWFLKRLKLNYIDGRKDGALLKKGDIVLIVEGRADTILSAERTILNLIQRMSGVATKTRRMRVKLPPGIELLCTRKTLWGLLDKRAVVVGGGGTHRLRLSDAILVKENHIALSSNFGKSLKRVLKKRRRARFIEIELESINQVHEFLMHYEPLKKKLNVQDSVIVMLDNFTPSMIKKVLEPLKKAGAIIELSGGINESNISRYSIAGVSAISSGVITTKAHNLDISLEVVVDK
ncbi:MAG: carboxylating nicotinate-nucleotide diphosphorylase [Candidatus Peregrinibacteria bacterium]|nr:carboxylating nicotinate-nucleotide diphosphorylase [Candidatus Peregrinibacteria bacterium]